MRGGAWGSRHEPLLLARTVIDCVDSPLSHPVNECYQGSCPTLGSLILNTLQDHERHTSEVVESHEMRKAVAVNQMNIKIKL